MQRQSVVVSGALLLMALHSPGVAQETEDSVRSSLGLRIGYAVPLGDWHLSPVAPQVNLIGGNFCLELDLDFAIGRKWTLGLEGGYAALNGSDWEDYAATFGERLEISGSFVHCAVLLRPHIMLSGANVLRMEFGPAVLFASGEEVFEGRTYPYDFLGGTSFGMKAGIEYYRILSPSVALSLKASVLYFPSASQHTAQGAKAISIVPLMAGIRFLL